MAPERNRTACPLGRSPYVYGSATDIHPGRALVFTTLHQGGGGCNCLLELSQGSFHSMELIVLILLFVAAGCFVAAFFNAPVRYHLVAGGLFCWVLTEIIVRL